MAVAHSILIAVYHVIKDDCDYKELGADYLDAKIEKKRRSYLTKELEEMGYDVVVTQNMPKQVS